MIGYWKVPGLPSPLFLGGIAMPTQYSSKSCAKNEKYCLEMLRNIPEQNWFKRSDMKLASGFHHLED